MKWLQLDGCFIKYNLQYVDTIHMITYPHDIFRLLGILAKPFCKLYKSSLSIMTQVLTFNSLAV